MHRRPLALLLLLSFVVCAAPLAAQTQILAAASTIRLMPLSDFGGPLRGIVAQGDYAYAGEGNSMVVLDVHDPTDPEPIGALGVALGRSQISGSLLYTAAAEFRVIDIGNPRAPRLLSFVATPGNASDVVLFGNLAYIADGSAGLLIVDLSDPARPLQRGSLDTPGNAVAIAVAGGYAYIADTTGVQIINVADPDRPVTAGRISASGNIVDVEATGQWVYVAAVKTAAQAGDGLLIFDRSDPVALRQIGQYISDRGVDSIQLLGDLALVNGDALDLVDVSNRGRPTRLGSYVPSTAFYATADRLYSIIGRFLDIVEFDDPREPVYRGTYPTPGYVLDVQVSNGFAYTSDIEGALWIYDARDPGRARLRGVTGLPVAARSIDVARGFVYLLGGDELVVVDARDVTEPIVIAELAIGRDAQTIRVIDGIAYIAGGSDGVLIYDVGMPADPQLLSRYATAQPVLGLDLAGSRLYAAAGTAGLLVLDVSDLEGPALVGTYPTPNNRGSHDVAVDEDIAYVLFNEPLLQVLDVSQPTAIDRIGQIALQSTTVELARSGSLLYVTELDRVELVDARNAAEPVVAATIPRLPPGGSAGGVAVSGADVYVADGLTGVQIFRRQFLSNVQFLPLAQP